MNDPKYKSGDLIGYHGKLWGIVLKVNSYHNNFFNYVIFWTHNKKKAVQSVWLIETCYDEFWKRKV